MNRQMQSWVIPLGLLVILILSFGLMIPWLGFYWDDWPVIMTYRLQGVEGFWKFYQYDRPISAWTYAVTMPILGIQPANWHIFTLMLRWLTVISMWWTSTLVWPNHKVKVTWAAFLFAIYPVFTQQAISVAYSQHWLCYLLFFISLGTMLQARRTPRWFFPLTVLSLVTSLAHLLTMEYFAGLELLRPVLLWFLASEKPGTFRDRATAVLKAWLPYLTALTGFVIWRLVFLKFPGEDANPPILLFELFKTPVQSILRLAQNALQDIAYLFVNVWTNSIKTDTLQLQDRFVLFSWGVAVLAAAGIFAFLKWLGHYEQATEAPPAASSSWRLQCLLAGVFSVLLGTLPVWITDRQIIVGMYSNRFGLPAMFGMSLVMVGLIDWFIAGRRKQIFLISVLVGLAVGQHVRLSNDYRWSWVKQTRFYWQLSWRAPHIQPETAIFSEGEIFPNVGLYSTAAGINLLYPTTRSSDILPYWFYSLGREFAHQMPEFQSGIHLEQGFRNYVFRGDTRSGLVLQYEPDRFDCLEILTAADRNTPEIAANTLLAMQNTDLAKIDAQPSEPGYPPTQIFGAEPERGWCYLYQKADLARQEKNWQQVVALSEHASEQGYDLRNSQSNTPQEWIPFIEGYAHTGRWSDAVTLTQAVLEKEPRMAPRLCDVWNGLENTYPETVEIQEIRSKLDCTTQH